MDAALTEQLPDTEFPTREQALATVENAVATDAAIQPLAYLKSAVVPEGGE